MKLKKLLIITVLISATTILYGCGSSKLNEISSDENNSTKSEITSDVTSSDISNSNITQKSNEPTNDLNFKSKLGFSMQFPSNWKGKYRIEEDDEGLYVYFKSKDPKTPENSGLIFVIKKKYDSTEEGMLDSIGSKKFITVNNTKYLIGGPTDIGLSPENTEFDKYTSMRNECEKVIDTVTSSN